MKHLLYYYMMAFAVLSMLLTACEEENNSQLTVAETLVTFPAKGGSEIITIESNTSWHVISESSWVSVYPTTGSMSKNITVTAVPTGSKLEEETRIIIMTDDGSKVVNVTVKAGGSSGKKGTYIDIDEIKKVLSGKAGSLDSIVISANTSWELLGPEWIEAWDGGRWRPMSQDRAVIKGNGNGKVYFRTIADNRGDDKLFGVIFLHESLTGDFSRTINIKQLGRLDVDFYFPCTLEDGFVIGWHCGCDVAKIYYKVTLDLDEKFDTSIKDTYKVTDESFINGEIGLASGTTYKIIAEGEDKDGNMPGRFTSAQKTTSIEYGNVWAEIAKGEHVGGGQWQFYIGYVGIDTYYYQLYATGNLNSAFRYNDPILWYIAQINSDKNMWYGNSQYTTPGWVYLNNLSGRTDEIHAMTLAVRWTGISRKKVFRYDRYYDTDGKLLPEKPLLDRIPKDMIYDASLR